MRVVLGRSVQFGNQVRTAPIQVHPECVAAALQAEDTATRPEGLVDDLRAASDGVPPDRLEAALARIGAI